MIRLSLLGVVAVLTFCTPVFGQATHFDLSSLYKAQMKGLPTRFSATSTFRSIQTREQLIARYDRFTAERLKIHRSRPSEVIDEECRRLGIARENVEGFISKGMAEGLRMRLLDLDISGKHEFYLGDFREIRSYSLDGVRLKTLQYGTSQPKLQTDTRKLWVIQENEKKGGKTVLLTESRVALNAMQHFAMYHPAIEQKFSSCFNEFWQDIPKISHWRRHGEEEIFIKKYAELKLGIREGWLVCSISNPENSIIPQWIARINAPGKSDLSDAEMEQIVDCAIAIQHGKGGKLPNGLYIHSLVTFSDFESVGEFASFPKTITYVTCMDWQSSTTGFTEERPLEEFQLKVSAINLDAVEPPRIEVKDGDSFFDYETKSGMIIGQPPVRTVGKYGGITRWILWFVATGSVLLLLYRKFRG